MGRQVDKIHRPTLSDGYKRLMIRFLMAYTRRPRAEIEPFVNATIAERVHLPNVRVEYTKRPGFVEVREMSMKQLLVEIKDKIITPSGSVFFSPKERPAITTKFIADFKSHRKHFKGLQFKAKEDGQLLLMSVYNAIQNAIKITLNSLPGALGYAGSVFIDKGSYNAVTSTGRCQISNAFVGCEQFFMANIPLYCKEELYNLLTCILDLEVSKDDIRGVMEHHHLEWVTKDEVIDYLERSLKRYRRRFNFRKDVPAMRLIETFSDEELQFMWYHSSLYNLMIAKNSELFKPKLLEVFDYSTVSTTVPNTAKQFWSYHEDLLILAIMVLAPEVGSIKKDDIASLEEHAELRSLVIGMCERFSTLFEEYEDIHQVFMNHELRFQRIMTRSSMRRKSIALSDTDSIIYSVVQWSNWINGKEYSVDKSSYDISAFVTFWLLRFNAEIMEKFSIDLGATGENISILAMKNEFMYPIMMLFDIKKTYAALCAANEGVVNPELEPDIKGSNIRGADASKEASDFCKSYLVNEILKPAITGTVDYKKHIEAVLRFEYMIMRSLTKRDLRFVPNKSLREKSQYAQPDRTAHFYRIAWDEVFTDSYSSIPGPGKYKMVPVIEKGINSEYLEWLEKKNPTAAMKLKRFMEKHQKEPKAFLLPPDLHKIPTELMPLLDVRKLVHRNAKPLYRISQALRISVGIPKKTQLLSDIYSSDGKYSNARRGV